MRDIILPAARGLRVRWQMAKSLGFAHASFMTNERGIFHGSLSRKGPIMTYKVDLNPAEILGGEMVTGIQVGHDFGWRMVQYAAKRFGMKDHRTLSDLGKTCVAEAATNLLFHRYGGGGGKTIGDMISQTDGCIKIEGASNGSGQKDLRLPFDAHDHFTIMDYLKEGHFEDVVSVFSSIVSELIRVTSQGEQPLSIFLKIKIDISESIIPRVKSLQLATFLEPPLK